MISTILRFEIERQTRTDFRGAYHHLLGILRRIPGANEWFCGVNTPKEKAIPFIDEDAVVRRLRERAELMQSESFRGSAGIHAKNSRSAPNLLM